MLVSLGHNANLASLAISKEILFTIQEVRSHIKRFLVTMLLVRRHFNALKEIASMISAMAMGLKPKGLHLWKLSPLHRLRNLSPASVQNIRFGFSYDSKGFGFIWWEKIAGILGLNRDPNSMIVQLGRLVLNRFSYCLVQPDKSFRIYLKFGDEMYEWRGDQLRTTSFVKHPNSYVYGLNLLDISIAGKRLNLPPNTFSIKSNGQGGCMIDSGSVQTIIEYEVYLDLWTAFTEYFARYDIERLITCPNYGVLCFKMPAGFNSFPSMTYHFQGADLKIEPDNVSSLIIKIPIFSQQSHL